MISPFYYKLLTINYQLKKLSLQRRLIVIETTQANLDKLVVVFFLGESWRKFYADIVPGESMHRFASWRLLEENLSLSTDVLSIEFLRFLITQLQQSLGAFLLLLLVNHIRNLQGSRARTLRIREIGRASCRERV